MVLPSAAAEASDSPKKAHASSPADVASGGSASSVDDKVAALDVADPEVATEDGSASTPTAAAAKKSYWELAGLPAPPAPPDPLPSPTAADGNVAQDLVGLVVRLQDLKGRAELNGRRARALRYDPEAGRLAVQTSLKSWAGGRRRSRRRCRSGGGNRSSPPCTCAARNESVRSLTL